MMAGGLSRSLRDHLVLPVVLREEKLVEPVRRLPGEAVRQLSVLCQIDALLMDQGGHLPRLLGELEEGGAGPAALLKQLRHQEAGGEVAALPPEVPAQGLPGRGVGPDQIGRGVVLVKALQCGGVKAGPDAVIGVVAVASPGLVVAEEIGRAHV